MRETRVVESPVDGLTRLIHFRRVKDHPLAVVVSQTEQDYLAEHQGTVRTFVQLGGVVSVGAIVLALLLIHLARSVERARRLTAASQDRYRRLFESAPMAYQSLDGEGRISAVNTAWERLFGVAAADACGLPASRFLGEPAMTGLACTGGDAVSAGSPGLAPLEIRRSDGARRLVVVAGCTQSLSEHGVAFSQSVLRDVTDEVAQALRLEASERKLRGIVESINAATWEVELASGRFSYVSPQVETMFGYSTEQWSSANFWDDHLHPLDRDRAVYFHLSQVALGLDHSIEYRFIKHDGSVAWVRDIVKVLRNAAGAPDRLAGVMLDTTAEKAAAAELAKQHALLRSLIDSVPDLIFFKNLQSVYMGCNLAFCEFAGRPESAQIGKTDLDFFDRDTAEFFRARDRDMLAAGESRRNEEWVTYPDRHQVLLDTLKAPIFDAQGQAIGLIGISRDITESKRAEETLLLAHSVFESTSEGILVTDQQSRILMVNPAFTAITGWSAEDVVGHNPSMFQSGRHPPRFYAELWSYLLDHGHWQGEIWNRRKNGDVFAESMTISAVRDSCGAVTRYVGLFADITQRKQQEEEIWHQANFDALTGLANRSLFHDRLGRALARARRKTQQVGLLFLDLDRFKWINDSLGHDAGDQLLVEAAQRLNACVREDDTVARLGGDEFTIVLQGLVDREPLQVVIEKVLEALSRPFVLHGSEHYVSASIGVTVFPGDADNSSDLLRNADIAMYQAKAAGRNCYSFYSSHMRDETLARVELEQDLRRDVKSGEFALHYLPVIDIGSRKLAGAEALLRWQHPTRGLLAPAEFLAVAEECGLMVGLGEWVIGELCRQWRTWVDAGLAPVRITFNLTNSQFRHPALCDAIGRAMALHGVPGAMLALDLTEPLMLGRGTAPLQRLLELKQLGLHFSLDDFGTGYSSLTTLKDFPFDTVKIDRSFITRLPASSVDQQLVEAIILMAHSLKLEVLAEGVENEAQLALLRALGCDLAQGFLVSRPLDAQQFGEFLDRRAHPAGYP